MVFNFPSKMVYSYTKGSKKHSPTARALCATNMRRKLRLCALGLRLSSVEPSGRGYTHCNPSPRDPLTLILGSPALLSDCVDEELDTMPEPPAELRSLPKDSEEPRPDVEDMDPEPDAEDTEPWRPLPKPSPPRCLRPSGGGCSLNLKGDMCAAAAAAAAASSPRCSGWCVGCECGWGCG